jgi:hypothetical protein
MLQNQSARRNNSFAGKISRVGEFEIVKLIAQQFFQLLARGVLALVDFAFLDPVAPGEIEKFAEIAGRLFQDRIRPAFPALLRDPQIVMRAIQARAQIRAAFHANFAATRLAVQRPKFAAILAMSGGRHL